MRTASSVVTSFLFPLARRTLVAAGFLFGFGILALVSAGSAHADEDDRPPGLLGGVLDQVTLVEDVTDPVLSGVSNAVAPVVDAVEPLTAPLLAPVTGPLEPVLEALAPVTEPLLGPVEPVVTPVARAVGVQPGSLGVDDDVRVPAPAPVPPDVADAAPVWTAPQEQPRAAAAVPAVADVPWPAVEVTPTATVTGPERWTPAGGPASPDRDPPALAGATGTAASGNGAGGSPGQVDLPHGRGSGPPDGSRVIQAERHSPPPWCYVFGRHHPS